MAALLQLQSDLLQQRTAMIHGANCYVQTFLSFREMVHSTGEPYNYRMIVLEDKRPKWEHIRLYDGQTAFKVAAIISNAKD